MAYILDLFTPETWLAFRGNGATVTGFRERHSRLASERVSQGDVFLCYLTRLSRWCGVLQAETEAYHDDSPLLDDPDPFTVRFKVKPIVILDPESAIPIYDDKVWEKLTVTKQHEKGTSSWTGLFRGSLNKIGKEDGDYLVKLLERQQSKPESYPLSERDKRQLARKRKIPSLDRQVEVEVPDDEEEESVPEPTTVGSTPALDARESIRYQAKVAQIGAEMGFRIWVPRNDRSRVLELVPRTLHDKFLDLLPLNYDDTTLRTVEQIDVLWLSGRSMARAFEVEHTTAIYSGLLRMADLLALQPNMNIRLHIVAPPDKRERVLREIRRPVFSLLDRGPLYEQCSFLSYESVDQLAKTEYLSHMSDTLIGEYEESTEI
ncbi:MAG: hypothetical protein OXE05_03655 [Chloroflexi bacterium]|nr:hypothetical protein [Chloroflexota bacterium]